MSFYAIVLYIYIYIYTLTLTGHFIRYTLLGPVWTPFCLQNCLNSLWNRLNKVLETFLRVLFWSILTWRFVGCTSMMRISRSTTSQMCSIGLRSGDCGGHLSKMNSLPPSVRASRAPQVSALLECPQVPTSNERPPEPAPPEWPPDPIVSPLNISGILLTRCGHRVPGSAMVTRAPCSAMGPGTGTVN